jgi:hypothetical protein
MSGHPVYIDPDGWAALASYKLRFRSDRHAVGYSSHRPDILQAGGPVGEPAEPASPIGLLVAIPGAGVSDNGDIASSLSAARRTRIKRGVIQAGRTRP